MSHIIVRAHTVPLVVRRPRPSAAEISKTKKNELGGTDLKISRIFSGRRPENVEKNTPEMYPKLQIKANL